MLAALAACRTARMGGRLHRCDHCGGEVPLYNSCNDRHCPRRQAGKRAAWLERRLADLLPVEYFHVVFTVPEQLHGIARAHPGPFYNLLLRAVRETLLEIAASPKHLGAEIGGQMVLHTWSQTLLLHPHVHVIATGGGLTPDGQRWIASRRGYFLPEAVLARKFRGKLLDLLKRAHAQGRLPMTGGLARLASSSGLRTFLSPLYNTPWVVHVEPPAARPELVLKYLARYTYRVAISNSRIQSISQGRVTFRYKDYARGGCWRCMTLEADEFLRRFCLHILPKGFVRVRGFGLLANRGRAQKLARARQLLGASAPARDPAVSAEAPPEEAYESPPGRCPYCGRQALRLVGQTPRPRVSELAASTYQGKPFDTS